MRNRNSPFPAGLFTCLLALLPALPALAQQQTPAEAATALHDGQHDFDFEIGTWKTHLKRRIHPLSGSNEWTEYDGTTTVRKVWNGRANLVELVADGPTGHFETRYSDSWVRFDNLANEEYDFDDMDQFAGVGA